MKTLLLLSMLMSLNVLASVESDSEALSQSFNTTPLGRTNIGYKAAEPMDEAKYNEDQKARLLACKQDPKLCPKEPPPVQKKTVKNNFFGKAVENTESPTTRNPIHQWP